MQYVLRDLCRCVLLGGVAGAHRSTDSRLAVTDWAVKHSALGFGRWRVGGCFRGDLGFFRPLHALIHVEIGEGRALKFKTGHD